MVERISDTFSIATNVAPSRGIVNFGEWKEVNLINSAEGTVRGHHYHTRTDEIFLILDGEVEVSVQKVEGGKLVGVPEVSLVGPGDAFIVRSMQYHIFKLKSQARWKSIYCLVALTRTSHIPGSRFNVFKDLTLNYQFHLK